MRPYDGVIFDLDGTLVDSLADLADATNRMLASFDRPQLGLLQVRQLVGQGVRRLVERAMPGASAEEVERGIEIFLSYNEAHIADRTVTYPGVAEILDLLAQQRVPMAILSNKNVSLCRTLLEALGIGRYFADIVGADSLPFRKPAPEPVLHILRRFDVAPSAAVMVGDSINDISAGKGAGTMTVGCRYGYGDSDEIAGADYLIDSLPELLGLPIFGRKTS